LPREQAMAKMCNCRSTLTVEEENHRKQEMQAELKALPERERSMFHIKLF